MTPVRNAWKDDPLVCSRHCSGLRGLWDPWRVRDLFWFWIGTGPWICNIFNRCLYKDVKNEIPRCQSHKLRQSHTLEISATHPNECSPCSLSIILVEHYSRHFKRLENLNPPQTCSCEEQTTGSFWHCTQVQVQWVQCIQGQLIQSDRTHGQRQIEKAHTIQIKEFC